MGWTIEKMQKTSPTAVLNRDPGPLSIRLNGPLRKSIRTYLIFKALGLFRRRFFFFFFFLSANNSRTAGYRTVRHDQFTCSHQAFWATRAKKNTSPFCGREVLLPFYPGTIFLLACRVRYWVLEAWASFSIAILRAQRARVLYYFVAHRIEYGF